VGVKVSKSLFFLVFIVTNFTTAVLAKDLILSAPPRETPEAGNKMYSPIAGYLSEMLGVNVKYIHPGNWLNYQREMRSDKYDIIFDGPHFIASKEKKNCDAAVLRTAFHDKKLTDEQRSTLKTLFISKAMPNQGISVSRRISAEQKLRIKAGLTESKGMASTKILLTHFAGKAKSLIPTQSGEYAGYNNLLEGVIFGW